MSLVISAWNKSMGVAISEGRVGAWVGGKYLPTEEDHSKITRLPNGSVLGIAGHSRDGYGSYASLTGVCADRLLPAIVGAASVQGFSGLAWLIPALLAECNRDHPELFFCVSLLGPDEGTVRGGAWDSDGKRSMPSETEGAWIILSPSAEFSQEVDRMIQVLFSHIGMDNSTVTSALLENIFHVLAGVHPDINNHTFTEVVSAAPVSMNASNISTGTLSASKVLFPDGSSLSTAARIVTSRASPTSNTTVAAGATTDIAGWGISATAASTADTFTFNVAAVLATSTSGSQTVTLQLKVDGVVKTSVVLPVSLLSGGGSLVYSLTGLASGAHTFQMTINNSGNALGVIAYATSVLVCQRVY